MSEQCNNTFFVFYKDENMDKILQKIKNNYTYDNDEEDNSNKISKKFKCNTGLI